MILQSLASYYDDLAEKGLISRPGWADVKVSLALEINDKGELLAVLPLKSAEPDGKKPIPRIMKLPAPVKKTSGIAANFLCNNSAYMLGFDGKGKPGRAKACFEAAKELHLSLLGELDDPAAKAVCAFFREWQPDRARENPLLADYMDELEKGENIVFVFNGAFLQDNPALAETWQNHYDEDEEGTVMRCLITGKKAVAARTHPSVKGVRDAQSSGAALVSFNASAYCSFEKEQNLNAPVSKYAAFAYTTALNHLLADKRHTKLIGDTTTVYWSEDVNSPSHDIFSAILDGDNTVSDKDLDDIMKAVSLGETVMWNEIPVNPDNRFYVLVLAPNAARISVRFFLRDTFGTMVNNLKKHYDRLDIVKDNKSTWKNIPLWALLRETVNKASTDKKPLPQMSGDFLRAMLTGGRYPATLYNQIMLRIRAERTVSRERAAAIKAYLLRNTDDRNLKEVLTVALNETSEYAPYVLGRLFSVLEGTQQAANPGINSTIKDRFFNSACATPAAVFPILLKLSNSHLRKLEGGMQVYWSKRISELVNMLNGFPQNLSLNEQGAFILGYYHQTQKRYEKKEEK